MKNNRILLMVILLFTLSGCGSEKQSSSDDLTSLSSQTSEVITSEDENSTSTSSGIVLMDFEGITMNNQSIKYDGQPHTIIAVGVEIGAKVTYTNAGPFVNVGVYNIKVRVEKEGYNTLDLSATLTITPINFEGITFSDLTIEYDGIDHKADVVVQGLIPDGSNITYTYKQNNVVVEELINPGIYEVKVNIVNPNFNPIELTATLTIKATEKEYQMVVHNGQLYFSNALDGGKLYVHDGEEITRVSNDVPRSFTNFGSEQAFIADSTFLPSIKTIDNLNQIKTIHAAYTQNISGVGETLYYAVNKLTQDSSGIFKMVIGVDGKPVVTQIYSGKNKHLTVIGSYVYFADGRNGNKLSRVSVNANNVTTATVVVDEKITELTTNGNNLVFNVNNLTGDYIGSFNLGSSTFTKLTIDAGKYLSIVNDYVYYSNIDFLTSTMFGKGIYKVPLNGTFGSKSGTKVIDGAEYQLSSLYHNNGLLYYYSVANKHLYTYNLTSGVQKDLLEDFVAPIYIPTSMGGKTLTVGTKLYYTNIHQDKTLFVYDSVTNKNIKLTSEKVEDFALIGDYLYLNQVSYGINNDLYAVNINTGGIPELISSDDARNIVGDDTHIYYVKHNLVGAATSLIQIEKDGSNPVEFYNKGATNLRIKNNKLYFLSSGSINFISLNEITQSTTNLTATQLGKISNIAKFEFDGDNIIYSYRGVLTKEMRSSTLGSFDKFNVLASSKTDPLDFVVNGQYVYYYSQAESSMNSTGIYKVDKTAIKDGTQTLVLAYDGKYYASSLSVSGDSLYFINYQIGGLLGDSHTYKLPLSGSFEEPIIIDNIF